MVGNNTLTSCACTGLVATTLRTGADVEKERPSALDSDFLSIVSWRVSDALSDASRLARKARAHDFPCMGCALH